MKDVPLEQLQFAADHYHVVHMPLSPEGALADYLDTRFTKSSYTTHRKCLARHGIYLRPYHHIKAAMDSFIPTIVCGEDRSEVELQDLVKYTTEGIIRSRYQIIPRKLRLIFKWGCDGCSGQSEYHQRGGSHSSEFGVYIVPLQLVCEDGSVLWENDSPSSGRLCRPVKLIYTKETTEETDGEENRRSMRNLIRRRSNRC